MKHLAVLALLFVTRLPVSADEGATHIGWHGWYVRSSEILAGHRLPLRHPLTCLFDGDPRTAWQFTGKGRVREGEWKSRFALSLTSMHPVEVDAVRLMNGDNRSRASYLGHPRAGRIRVTVNGQEVKSTSLSDAMGWHKIGLPRRMMRSLVIEFTGVRGGVGAGLRIAELELASRGRLLPMRMPRAILFGAGGGPGCNCGATDTLISRRGRVLASTSEGAGYPRWSPSGRRVAGLEHVHGRWYLWAVDAWAGRRTHRVSLRSPRAVGADELGVQWLDERRVEVFLRTGAGRRSQTRLEVIRIP